MSLEVLIPEIGEIPSFGCLTMRREDWRDGLIVRTPNWLGDFVMCVPALMQLRKAIPAACSLVVIAPKGFAPVLEALGPLVDKTVLLSDPHSFPAWKEFMQVRAFHAGAGILFNNSFRDALWMKCAGIPNLCGAKARNRSFLLKKAPAFPKRMDFVLNHPHQAAKYLALASLFGTEKWDGALPDMNLFPEPEIYSDGVRLALKTEHLLAVAPGAAYGSAKKWSPESYREVCRFWIEKTGGKAVLLSAKNEVASAQEAIAGLPEEHVIDLAGKTNLGELMRILKQAEICLANDSGTMHLSALVGGKGVCVFGSTDPAATSPISSKWRILYDKQTCSPCFKRICPYGSKKCLTCVPPSAVITQVKELCGIP